MVRQLSSSLAPLLVVPPLLVTMLHLMGRLWWCPHGDLSPWVGDAWGAHTSQHLFDPYSFSHVQHGLLFFAVLHFARVPLAYRLPLVFLLEGGWEILENTPLVIERYRSATASLEYYGDSIGNSLGDLLSCVVGYLIARSVPRWAGIGLYAAIEVVMIMTIRDSLTLNVLSLVYPVAAIKAWQLAPQG